MAGWYYIEDSPRQIADKPSAPRFDYVGTGFIALALGCLERAVDRGENLDWLGSGWWW